MNPFNQILSGDIPMLIVRGIDNESFEEIRKWKCEYHSSKVYVANITNQNNFIMRINPYDKALSILGEGVATANIVISSGTVLNINEYMKVALKSFAYKKLSFEEFKNMYSTNIVSFPNF